MGMVVAPKAVLRAELLMFDPDVTMNTEEETQLPELERR